MPWLRLALLSFGYCAVAFAQSPVSDETGLGACQVCTHVRLDLRLSARMVPDTDFTDEAGEKPVATCLPYEERMCVRSERAGKRRNATKFTIKVNPCCRAVPRCSDVVQAFPERKLQNYPICSIRQFKGSLISWWIVNARIPLNPVRRNQRPLTHDSSVQPLITLRQRIGPGCPELNRDGIRNIEAVLPRPYNSPVRYRKTLAREAC